MKFTIQKSEIVEVLSKIQGLTGRRSSLAITECVLITASEGSVHLIATDLETGYEGNFQASVEEVGTIAVSARKFYEIVREYPSAEIKVEEKPNRIVDIGNQKVQYHLKSMNPEDFPNTPDLDSLEMFSVESTALKNMIDKTIVISGVGEDKKAHINGVYFERLADVNPPVIRMVSTDGSRLSKCDLGLAEGEGSTLPPGDSVLIPKKGLHEISKFLDAGGTVKLAVQNSYFVVQSSLEKIYIRLLEGQFPKYAEIIFRDEGNRIVMEKEQFLNMLKRMSILCNDSYRATMFTFDADQLVINATNPDIGESKEDMAIEFKGGRIEAAFNPKFFIDALNCIDDSKVIVNILSLEKPCLIHGIQDKTFLSAVMPMRV